MLCAILIVIIIVLTLILATGGDSKFYPLLIIPIYFIYKWFEEDGYSGGLDIPLQTIQRKYDGGSEVTNIQKMKKPGVEIEAVFSINNYQYDLLKRKLSEHKEPVQTMSVVEISDNIRRITEGKSIHYEQKDSEIILRNDNYKIRKATEVKITPPKQFIPKLTRNRVRDTFILKEFKDVQFDLTRVNDGVEFEIELLKPSGNFEEAIAFIENILLEGTMPFNVGERQSVIEQHNKLVSSMGNNLKKVNDFMVGYENKPKDLTKNDLLGDYYVTLKYDGVRRFLLTLKQGIYLIEKDLIWKLSDQESPVNLYDGEFMKSNSRDSGNSKYYAFDVLVYNGENVTNKSLPERLILLNKLSEIPKIANVDVLPKEYYTKGNLFERLELAYKEYENPKDGLKLDGIILQPLGNYKSDVKKWKPKNMLTIDFLLRKNGKEYDLLTHVRDGQSITYEPFHIKYKGKSTLEYESIDNRIIECRITDKGVELIRFRNDKVEPNSSFVANKVWETLQNPVEVDTLLGRNLALIRRYNQIIKSNLIRKYIPDKSIVIDVGSGRGADLAKWKRFKKIYTIEPDSEVLKIFEDRRKEMKDLPEIVVLNTGAENTSLIKKTIGDEQISAINLFYCLTFFGKDKTIYKKLLDTLAMLPKGVKVIGSVMDGSKVIELCKDDSFKNTAFSIKLGRENPKKGGQPVHININDPDSMIKDLDEWIFDYDKFQEDMEKMQFKVLENYFYDDSANSEIELYKYLPTVQKEFGSLFRVFVFEKM